MAVSTHTHNAQQHIVQEPDGIANQASKQATHVDFLGNIGTATQRKMMTDNHTPIPPLAMLASQPASQPAFLPSP